MVLYFLISIVLFGVGIVELIFRKAAITEKIVLGFLLGNGIFTLLLFLLGLAGFNYTFLNVFILVTLIGPIFYTTIRFAILKSAIVKKNGVEVLFSQIRKFINSLSRLEKFIFAFIVFILFSALLSGFYWPVRDWDALTLYDFRARTILDEGNLSVFHLSNYYISHPPMTTFSHLWVYIAAFKYPVFIYVFYYLSLVYCFYRILIKFIKRKHASIFTLLLVIFFPLYEHAGIAYTNLPYTTYIILGLLYLFCWVKNANKGFLLISALLVGLSTWTRSTEPIWVLALLVCFAMALYLRQFRLFVFYAAAVYLIRIPWLNFVSNITQVSAFTEAASLNYPQQIASTYNFNMLFEVLRYFWDNSMKHDIVLLSAFLISVFTAALYSRKNLKNILLSLIIVLGAYSLLLVGSYIYRLNQTYANWIQLGESLRRISMLFTPLLLFFTAVNMSDLKDNKEL